MSAQTEEAFVAVPGITQIVATACYNDADARWIADKENLVDYDEADPETQRFWRFIAAAALNACFHMELVEVLRELIGTSYSSPDWERVCSEAKSILAKARGEQ